MIDFIFQYIVWIGAKILVYVLPPVTTIYVLWQKLDNGKELT
jgi:hypothetical protein